MNKVTIDFLDWAPDTDEHFGEGLENANAVIHTENGYVPARVPSAAAASTLTPFTGGAGRTVNALRAIEVGNNGVIALAALHAPSPTTGALRIGIAETQVFTTQSFATMSSIGASHFRNFSIAQIGQNVAISAVAEVSLLSGGSTVYSLGGSFSYTVTSV